MVDPVNSNVSGTGYTPAAGGTGQVDKGADATGRSQDGNVTTSHRPGGPEVKPDPYVDDFEDVNTSAIGEGLFGGADISPDKNTELLLTFYQALKETLKDSADIADQVRVAAEEAMRADTKDQIDSMHKGATAEMVMGTITGITDLVGGTAGSIVGYRGTKFDGIKAMNYQNIGQATNALAGGASGLEKAFMGKGIADKKADETQAQANYGIDSNVNQHASGSFGSLMGNVTQVIQSGSEVLKGSEQVKRQTHA